MHSTLRFTLEGLERKSQQIAVLEGTLKVTAAEELLRFVFDDVTKPSAKKEKGVGVDLHGSKKMGPSGLSTCSFIIPPIVPSSRALKHTG